MTKARMTCSLQAAGCAVAITAGLMSHAVLAAAPDSPDVDLLLKQLVDPSFAVRAHAAQGLETVRASDVGVLEAAAMRDAEQAARIVGVLEQLFVGDASDSHTRSVVQSMLLSPSVDAAMTLRRIGDFGETETTFAAEQALTRLADSESPAASYAAAALSRNQILRESRAIEAIRRNGGRIIFENRPDPRSYSVLRFVAESPEYLEQAIASEALGPRMISHVILLPQWKAGDDGLAQLRRLKPSTTVQLYAVDGCGVTEEDAATLLKAGLPFDYTSRGAATLGVASPQGEVGMCRVSNVTPGLAADRAGIRENDIIVSANGQKIYSFSDLVVKLKDYKPGDEIQFGIIKGQGPFFGTPPFDPTEPEPKAPELPQPEFEIKVILTDWSQLPDFPPALGP